MTKEQMQDFRARLWEVVDLARRHAVDMNLTASLITKRAVQAQNVWKQLEEAAVNFDKIFYADKED